MWLLPRPGFSVSGRPGSGRRGASMSIFICDGTKEAPEKNTIDKLTGKKTPAILKSAIQRALGKIEPKK